MFSCRDYNALCLDRKQRPSQQTQTQQTGKHINIHKIQSQNPSQNFVSFAVVKMIMVHRAATVSSSHGLAHLSDEVRQRECEKNMSKKCMIVIVNFDPLFLWSAVLVPEVPTLQRFTAFATVFEQLVAADKERSLLRTMSLTADRKIIDFFIICLLFH